MRSKALVPAAATQTRLDPHRIATFAVRCFTCGRTGRMPIRADLPLRPELVLCPTCRAPAVAAAPRPAPATVSFVRASARARASSA